MASRAPGISVSGPQMGGTARVHTATGEVPLVAILHALSGAPTCSEVGEPSHPRGCCACPPIDRRQSEAGTGAWERLGSGCRPRLDGPTGMEGGPPSATSTLWEFPIGSRTIDVRREHRRRAENSGWLGGAQSRRVAERPVGGQAPGRGEGALHPRPPPPSPRTADA